MKNPTVVGMSSHGCPVHHYGWTGGQRRCTCTVVFDPAGGLCSYEPIASRRPRESQEAFDARWRAKVAAHETEAD